MPVEIFSFLLSLVPVPERAGKWFFLGTLSVYFASMMSTRFSKDFNNACALLGEETVVPDEFVQSIRAAITNADTCPPKSWEDVYHDLGAGFPVDCSGVRYVDEDPEEQDGEAESQSQTHTPKKKPKTALASSPSGTQCAQATPASSSGTVAPSGRGMNAFVNHFSPSQGGNTQSHHSATAKPGAATPAKPPANTWLRSPVHLVCASANASPTAYIAYQYEVWPKFRPTCSPQPLQPLIIVFPHRHCKSLIRFVIWQVFACN